MQIAVSESLSALVRGKYDAAKNTGSIIFSPTELSIIRTSLGVPFQLRFCPSLAKKPKPKAPSNEAPSKKFDPFDNPSGSLFITDIPSQNPTHLLVLNKFPIITEHFIIATKANKPQTYLLEQDDIETTYACLKAWEKGDTGELYAFFNCGEHSGASQPHRHLQFLPADNMQQDQADSEWSLLINRLTDASSSYPQEGPIPLRSSDSLPFTNFFAPVPPNPTPSQLYDLYLRLYEAAETSVRSYIASHPGQLELHDTHDGSVPISYNLALTTSTIAICPRRKGGSMLYDQDGSTIGYVELNGTVLAGTLMVKGESEWEALKSNTKLLDNLLGAIGIPPTSSEGIKL